MRKQLDPRIPTLINNGVRKNHRSFIVLVGDKGRDQVMLASCIRNLTSHRLYSCVGCQPPLSALTSPCICAAIRALVLQEGAWFQQVSRLTTVFTNLVQLIQDVVSYASHRKQREAKIKREVKRGIREPNEQDPFEIFVTVTDIRYTCANPQTYPLHCCSLILGRYYKESHKILGNTYGMCVLQDFEAVTPNLLARTVETVEGGGLIILLLKTMTSLRQLYTMAMVCVHFYPLDKRAEDPAGRSYEIPDFRP